MHLRTLYFRNLLSDLKDHWIVILIAVLICGAGLGLYGYKNANKKLDLTPEQEEKIANFEARVASYDAAIEDTLKCIDDNTEAIENLQNYIDHSIYMQIDPDDIKAASVQYVIVPEDGVTVSNVQHAVLNFINDGGLVSSLNGEYSELKPEYWREIIAVSCPSNLVIITVMHYDADSASRILSIICEKLAAQCAVIREKQGGFSLEGEETAFFVKGDANVANTQNTNRNNLRSYQSIRSDYETKYVTQNEAKDNYIENNTPEEISYPSPTKTAVKFGIFGLIAGAALVIGILALRYIFSDRIRREEELQAAGIAVLGRAGGSRGLKGNRSDQPASLYPSAERLAMDLKALTENLGCKGVFLQDLGGEKKKSDREDGPGESRMLQDIRTAVGDSGLNIASGTTEGDSAEELKEMLDLQSTLILVEAGKTTFRQLEKQLRLCSRFGIKILGCVLYE